MTLETMSPGERDKKMDEVASKAAAAFCRKHANDTGEQIEASPDTYLQYSIPYLTVRTLQRQEKALSSLEADSRWIKAFAIITGILTLVLAMFAWRLDDVLKSLHQSQSPTMSSEQPPAPASDHANYGQAQRTQPAT